jgi:hypothetical protein
LALGNDHRALSSLYYCVIRLWSSGESLEL